MFVFKVTFLPFGHVHSSSECNVLIILCTSDAKELTKISEPFQKRVEILIFLYRSVAIYAGDIFLEF